jgi:hypothetical protein
MPNLLVHIVAALAVSELLSVKQKSLLLLGAILPDAKIFFYPLITLVWGLPAAEAFIIPIHSLFGALLFAYFLSSLLPEKRRDGAFILLASGVLFHSILDLLMYPFSGIQHYLPLFPFSWSIVGVSAAWLLSLVAAGSLAVLGVLWTKKYFLT